MLYLDFKERYNMFNYQECTFEELVEHVKKSSRGAITQAKKYYIAKGELELVEAIDRARKVASRDKLLEKASKMSEGL